MLLQDAAHPDVGGRLEIGAADALAHEILRATDAGVAVDEHKAVAEAPMHENRDGGERMPLVARHEIGADILLAHIELVASRQPPVTLARSHAGEQDELDPVGRNGAVLERTHDLIIAAGDGEPELCRHRVPLDQSPRQRPKCTSARRTSSLSTIAMAASSEMSPRSLVGSKFCVNSVVK